VTLRQKLALGFIGLLLVIASIGIVSALQLRELGAAVDVVLRENYESVLACLEMKESLERMDSGALFTVMGHGKEGEELLSKNEPRFVNALERELGNITIPGEGEKAALLQRFFGEYRAALGTIRDPGVPRGVKQKAYFTGLLPLFHRIKDTADEILRMNQDRMVEMDRRARELAETARRQMYIMLLVATALSAGFLYLTGKWILRPITNLTRSTDEIRRGNLDLVVPSGSRDEIGRLSESFNAMAASLRELRRSDQAKLLRIQRSTQQAFDSLPDAIAVLSPDGVIEVSTEAAREAFGLRPAAKLPDLPYPWLAGLFDKALRTGRVTEPVGATVAVQQFVQGEERFYHPKAVPIMDSERHPAGVVLVLADVTAEHHQDEMKKGVLSTVSHQLKTPLTSIRMALHLLLEEKIGYLTDKQTELLVAAREDADRLNGILEDLLDIGRIESGKVSLDCAPESPVRLLTDAAEAFRSAARDRGVTLGTDPAGELPDVWVDKARIRYVFENLLSNALKYTSAGGRIVLSAEADPEFVRFRVDDTGNGIPEAYLSRVFDPFFQVPEQDGNSGAGLGLAIAKEIVEAHEGAIRAESREGAGSAFLFSLRRADRVHTEGKRT
jgi:signal transduction histidine kinase